jgi:hypothetical protein
VGTCTETRVRQGKKPTAAFDARPRFQRQGYPHLFVPLEYDFRSLDLKIVGSSKPNLDLFRAGHFPVRLR